MSDSKKKIPISTPSILLNQFLKLSGVVSSGGEAKILIQDHKVKVDGVVETRKKRQLIKGQVISVEGNDFLVD